MRSVLVPDIGHLPGGEPARKNSAVNETEVAAACSSDDSRRADFLELIQNQKWVARIFGESLAAIFRREKPDVLQDCRCSARQTAAPCRATMEGFHDLRLDSRTFETRFASRFDSCAPAHFDLSVCPSMSHVSRGSIRSSLPSRLYLLSRKSLSSIVRLP